MVYQNTIIGLRHEWTHPAWTTATIPVCLPEERQPTYSSPQTNTCCPDPDSNQAIAAAKLVIIREADEAGLSYEEMMMAAEDYLENKIYLNDGSRWEGHYLSNLEAFWNAYALIRGIEVPDENRHSFFSCSY